MSPSDFQTINVPKNLVDKLKELYEVTNEMGFTAISGKAEAVKRACEHYITLLDSLIEAKRNIEAKAESS